MVYSVWFTAHDTAYCGTHMKALLVWYGMVWYGMNNKGMVAVVFILGCDVICDVVCCVVVTATVQYCIR